MSHMIIHIYHAIWYHVLDRQLVLLLADLADLGRLLHVGDDVSDLYISLSLSLYIYIYIYI